MTQDLVLKKLEDHDKRFNDHDKKFDKISKQLLIHDKRFDEHDVRFDKIIKKLFEHDDIFIQIRQEMKDMKNEILSAIDAFAKDSKDVKIEQFSLGRAVSRHETDIIKIKKTLKIAN